MSALRTLFARIRGTFGKTRSESQLHAELLAHLEALTDENMRRGMTREEALQAARREFGGVEQAKELYRERRGLALLETLLQDMRYGLRMLRKSLGFTSAAVFTLALGIGANTAVFSIVDTVLLRPLPYSHPEQLYIVSETLPHLGGDEEVGVSAAEYFDYRDYNRSFSEAAAYEMQGFNLTGPATPLRVQAAALSASAFPLLGVQPILGQVFSREDDRFGAGSVVVLSHSLWEAQFGGDWHIVGKSIKLDERLYTVVAVMPASFQFPSDGAPRAERADVWVPEAFSPERLKDRVRDFGVGFIARLKPGVTAEQARSDIESIAAGFMQQYPQSYAGTVRVSPQMHALRSHAVEKARPLVVLLMAAVACVLLIACANVANLLVARASLRTREMAVRSAVGASRARLLRQCGIESFLLSALGAAGGVLLAQALSEGLRRFGPSNLPRLQDVTLSPLVLLFTLVISAATSLLFGFVPAWRLSKTSPQACLKEATELGSAHGSQKLQNFVAIVEFAVALVLLIGGSLLVESFLRLLNVPLGFNPRDAVVVRTLFDSARYPDALKREAVQKEILERISHLPGVSFAAAASHLPLSDVRQIGFRLEGAGPNEFHWAENSLVSPGYFRAMEIPLLRGRDFSEQDKRDTPPVAIISQTLAKEYFAGQDPIGRRFQWGDRAAFTIIGVAGDVHVSALDKDPPAMIYDSMFQVESGASARTAFVLRLAHSNQSTQPGISSAVEQQVWALDKDLPIYSTTTLAALVSESVAQRRFTTLLMDGFALVALLLAAIGLFSVVSYLVSQRSRELGLRMALGASPRELSLMVLKRGAALGTAGCLLGIALYLLTYRLLLSSLYQTSPFDLLTLSVDPLLLFGVSLLATYWPARRAMRVDPIVALRYE
jgi:putative ABC transport system permease protein